MTLQEAFAICAKKAHVHMENMNGTSLEARESRSGAYYDEREKMTPLSNRWTWTNSFITGMAPILYQTENDKKALAWANQFEQAYHDKVFALYSQSMHDLGFLYLPYSVHMYQLTGSHAHRDTALRAADELAKRFDVKGRYIEAWSEMNTFEKEHRMIVDSSMNVPLLFWAWKETGHTFYHDVAVAHLETIISTLVREDGSVCHAYFMDGETGLPKEEANSCGYANGSHWARGTGWIVYGLAIAYTYTQNEHYLTEAIRIAEKYIDSLTGSPVPIWDFRLPADKPAVICGNVPGFAAHWDETKSENTVYNVDTSAAAIMACACQLLCLYTENDRLKNYADSALCVLSNEYLDTDTQKAGMLRRSNGRDGFTVYGDYYYMLALAMKLYDVKSCWGFFGSADSIL